MAKVQKVPADFDVVLTLTSYEAEVVKYLLGITCGNSKATETAREIWDKIFQVIPGYDSNIIDGKLMTDSIELIDKKKKNDN